MSVKIWVPLKYGISIVLSIELEIALLKSGPKGEEFPSGNWLNGSSISSLLASGIAVAETQESRSGRLVSIENEFFFFILWKKLCLFCWSDVTKESPRRTLRSHEDLAALYIR